MLRRYDKNEDGVLKGDEWRDVRGVDSAADRNGDGSIDKDELARFFASRYRSGLGGQMGGAASRDPIPESRDVAEPRPAARANAPIEGPVERLLIAARHAPVTGLTDALNRHFGSSAPSQVHVVADTISNSLLITAAPELLKEVTAVVEQLDRPPAAIQLQLLIVERARQEPAAVTGAPSRPAEGETADEPLASGPAEEVLEKIQRWQAAGKLSVLHRVKMSMLENQTGLVQIGQNKPVVQGIASSSRGESRNISYQSVGLMVSATARQMGENAIAAELNFEKSDLATTHSDPPLAVSSTGEKIPSTRTVTSTAKSTITIPRGEAVVLADVSTTGSGGENRLLLVVTADASRAAGKKRD